MPFSSRETSRICSIVCGWKNVDGDEVTLHPIFYFRKRPFQKCFSIKYFLSILRRTLNARQVKIFKEEGNIKKRIQLRIMTWSRRDFRIRKYPKCALYKKLFYIGNIAELSIVGGVKNIHYIFFFKLNCH